MHSFHTHKHACICTHVICCMSGTGYGELLTHLCRKHSHYLDVPGRQFPWFCGGYAAAVMLV